ncbi:fluoride efflux transporter FluC [Daejeonella oryzae]|uniref:fluoride efflux transporter FluC n=1 Tax=Daejeonella oryzae TaxID=1122943 RepID=UPI0003FB6CE6|nr:CrcB family protein [Daejeonella oryzae]
MKEILLVFAGGGLGSVCRLMVSKLVNLYSPVFPMATLASNFLSCVIFGALVMLGFNRMDFSYSLKLLLITGFCGGFSTYSAFTFETVELFKNGQQWMGISNIILNFGISVAGLYLGMFAIKSFA